jgi:hypothetical protein
MRQILSSHDALLECGGGFDKRGLIFEVEKGFWESRPLPHRIIAAARAALKIIPEKNEHPSQPCCMPAKISERGREKSTSPSGPHYLNRPGPGVKACLAHGAYGPMGLISKHSG